ncbi:hypothetical protein QYE76_026867 [Lolium multiflorum]|uniref:Arabidopsis retrotransposon Orf1 C-terminal domain-containing protein n=1 Tax=Lolium multiflorum TaxID=4521 RepID=A0AAD8VY09_LOLMU|nr:hypothetical protein QYE76_026867 [Lolium multiflorum]
MSFSNLFRKSSGGGVDGSRSHHDPQKKARKGKEVLDIDFSKDYSWLSARKVLPTKWVDEGFLTSNNLDSDFTMLVFSTLNCDTYKHATLEFLATFNDELAMLGRNTIVRFPLNSVPHYLTLKEFCGCFGFSTTGDLEITDNSATIQNPTIRYFATFLVNSLFGKGDTGAMDNHKMSVICSALYPNMENWMNLDALLIQHFRRQRAANSDERLPPEETLLGSNIMIKLDMMHSSGEARDEMTTVKPHQYHQYQQPPQQPYMQPHPGYDYIPREEYDTLVSRVGDVESTLQDVNTNVMSLTQSFSEFSTTFQTYYPPQQGGGSGQ